MTAINLDRYTDEDYANLVAIRQKQVYYIKQRLDLASNGYVRESDSAIKCIPAPLGGIEDDIELLRSFDKMCCDYLAAKARQEGKEFWLNGEKVG